jgi:iron complex outermembrane receptor protein
VGAGKVIQYSQYAPFGYNGASYYLRLGVNF